MGETIKGVKLYFEALKMLAPWKEFPSEQHNFNLSYYNNTNKLIFIDVWNKLLYWREKIIFV